MPKPRPTPRPTLSVPSLELGVLDNVVRLESVSMAVPVVGEFDVLRFGVADMVTGGVGVDDTLEATMRMFPLMNCKFG